MRRDVEKVEVHIPIDVIPTFSSSLKETIAGHQENVQILYNLHVANTLADFIEKGTTMKGTKKDRRKDRKTDEAGPAAGFLTSDRLQRAAANITIKDLQGWGLDSGKYSKLLTCPHPDALYTLQ